MQETAGGISESVSSYFINLFSSYGVSHEDIVIDSVNFPRRVTRDRDIGRFLAFFVKRYQNGLVRELFQVLKVPSHLLFPDDCLIFSKASISEYLVSFSPLLRQPPPLKLCGWLIFFMLRKSGEFSVSNGYRMRIHLLEILPHRILLSGAAKAENVAHALFHYEDVHVVCLVGSALRFLKTDVALDSSKSATGIGAVLCNCQGDVLVAISRTIPDSYTPELGE
ncbi:hypothetical protein ACOSQ4_004508 [Xanthoceras sorbifolium]